MRDYFGERKLNGCKRRLLTHNRSVAHSDTHRKQRLRLRSSESTAACSTARRTTTTTARASGS
jgi:hypothetical protein